MPPRRRFMITLRDDLFIDAPTATRRAGCAIRHAVIDMILPYARHAARRARRAATPYATRIDDVFAMLPPCLRHAHAGAMDPRIRRLHTLIDYADDAVTSRRHR